MKGSEGLVDSWVEASKNACQDFRRDTARVKAIDHWVAGAYNDTILRAGIGVEDSSRKTKLEGLKGGSIEAFRGFACKAPITTKACSCTFWLGRTSDMASFGHQGAGPRQVVVKWYVAQRLQ